MESKDIIKALECCDKNPDLYCDKCPFKDKPEYCLKLSKYALELIKNQQAENERLQQNLKEAHIDIKEHMAEIERLTKRLNKVQMQLDDMCKMHNIIKNEAYKEFAELVKSRMFNGKKYDYERNYIDNLTNELTERKEDEGK